MKIQAFVVLACTAGLFAQEGAIPCRSSFDAVKNTYPRDAAANQTYAAVNGRITALENIEENKRKGADYEAELKNCDLAVELFKIQLSKAALRKNLDSLKQENLLVQKKISATKDSLIDLWASDAKGAKSLNAALNEQRERQERLNRENAQKDSIEKARLAEELAKKEKALAEKDSLLAAQKAEAEKRLDALRSKTINVYKDARGTILSMSDILFEFGKADLTDELKLNLAEIAGILKSLLTESKIEIEGHTDNVGTAASNKKLSEQRANAVLNYLVERGVNKKQLKAIGYGLSKPVASNDTPEGQAKNRRVELVIKD